MTHTKYRVRVSRRAKTPRLKLSTREGLVMVIPDGFDKARIPAIIDNKREWIRRAERRLRDHVQESMSPSTRTLPDQISLRAFGEDWSIVYRQTVSTTVTARDRRERQVLVCGNIRDERQVVDALRRWLMRKAREKLVPMLKALGRDCDLGVANVTIRSQRTRWASCSAKGTISLNLRLLFLPDHLLKYVLLHELSHVREMSHGRRYWAALEALEPNYRSLDAELRGAWRLVPEWVRPVASASLD